MKAMAFALPLLAAACGKADQSAPSPKQARAEDRVECALRGTTVFHRDCVVEESRDEAGLLLTLHAPDGGFRRLRVTKDGRGVVTADGALPAHVSVIGQHEIEVTIGDERYRLPATVK